ncbi:MAG: DUF2178 domain-containing protein [Candidatus Methylarchaceae archaeon HK02M2]|nr:DUF2178 domain-containing protein [Candidatus Methylarchaceae archaeon HK02M2]
MMVPIWLISIAGIAIIAILVGIVAVWKIVKERRSGDPLQDERTQKINGKAAYYTVIIGVYFMLGLSWVLFIGKIVLGYIILEAMPALIISTLVFILSFLGLRWYFNRKGDI